MKIKHSLFCGAADQFLLNLYNKLYENLLNFGFGWPRPISFDFILTFKCKSIRFYSVVPQTNFLWISISIQLKINQILFWVAPDEFPLIFYQNLEWKATRFCLGCPRQISFVFLLSFMWKSIKFCFGLAQTNFLWFARKSKYKSIKFCSGGPQTNFILFHIQIYLKINHILLWAGPDQVAFFSILISMKINEIPLRGCLQTNFLWFSINNLMTINQILLWAATLLDNARPMSSWDNAKRMSS